VTPSADQSATAPGQQSTTPGPVIDTHVHLLPGRLGEKVRAMFAPLGDSLAYPADHAQVRAQLSTEGIEQVWTLPYAHKPGVAEWLNEQTAAVAARPGPLTIIPGASVHPGDEAPEAIVRHAVESHGARVLKLHCSVGDFAADDRRLDQVFRYAGKIQLPVVVHVGHDSNGETITDELGPIEIVADRPPEAPLTIVKTG